MDSKEVSSLLNSEIPSVSVSTNRYDLEQHGRGESYHPTEAPWAVATPSNVDDVASLLKLCYEHRIPVVPYGAGTSVEGHVCAIHGGISLDTSELNSIHIDECGDTLARVGAGVTRSRLNQELRHTGMQFVVDPGADATIGGMVACGASGTTAVNYGTMRDNILALECVLPDGTIVNCGTHALKSSAGYDLVSLMTGSEGTLGVITNVTVKLHPIPQHVVGALCVFDELHQAAEAVAGLKFSGIHLARCELLDTSSVVAFNQYNLSRTDQKTQQMPEKPTLFLEFNGPSETIVNEQLRLAKSICLDDFGASDFQFTSQEDERRSLWAARHQLYYAAIALGGGQGAMVTDACVPLSKFADLMTATAKDVKDLGIIGPCFGHAGDGNFHCILPVRDDDSEEYRAKLHQINDNLTRRTLEAGGTCTGEHGIGYGKAKYLQTQYGSGTVKMMQLIKRSLDPGNIMNPGKVVTVK